jgi:type IV pilus assembly protein PilW
MRVTVHTVSSPRSGCGGFMLIELLVGMLLALFLLGGLGAIVRGVGRTSSNQISLATLQNGERTALTMLTGDIQQAGFYPEPQSATLQGVFPATTGGPGPGIAAFALAGQFLAGQTAATDRGDSVTVRYQTDSVGTVFNCLGRNSDTSPTVHTDTFSVSSSGQLVCSVDGATPVPLVGNIQSLTVTYGVDTTSTNPYSSTAASAYLRAADMDAVNWTNVRSVRIVLVFTNPLSGEPGQTTAPPVTVARTVDVMTMAGVNVVTSI